MKHIILSIILILQLAFCSAQENAFGSTKVSPYILKGDIYEIEHRWKLPDDFSNLKQIGTVYTDSLNIPMQKYTNGFPGVNNRLEWFCVNYNGYIYISDTGMYYFTIGSDDGSVLYIDNKLIVDNDGVHGMKYKAGRIFFNKKGVYPINVQYFQGPAPWIGLMLGVSRNGKYFKVLKLSEYMPVEIEDDGKTLTMSFEGGVLFEFNSFHLSKEAKIILDELMVFLNIQEEFKYLSIEGHTDDKGSNEYNFTLGENRAKAVKSYIASKACKSVAITYKSYGESKPKFPNNTEENRAKNRRIEIKLTR